MMVSSSIMHPESSEGLVHDFPDLVAEFESLSITPQSFDDNENKGKVNDPVYDDEIFAYIIKKINNNFFCSHL